MLGLCSVSHREVGTGPAHRNDSRARQARANQWQQITKHLSPQLNRIVRSVACPARRSPLPAFALDPGRYVSIKQDKKCAELQVARERARQPKSGSDRQISKRSNQRLLERREAQNARLRGIVVDLLLKIQALRDSAR